VEGNQPTVETVKITRWYLKNQRLWFHVECDQDQHAVCISTLDGTFFVDHHYFPMEVLKVEADLSSLSDLAGCHKFVALLTDGKRLNVKDCAVRDMGPGLALIHVGFHTALPPLAVWSSKQTAFLFVKWLQDVCPGVTARWDK
jgi:hypothetical protein